jgi:hypothetical protein
MMRKVVLLTAFSLLAGTAWTQEKTPLTLKLKDHAQGDTIAVEKKSTEHSTVQFSDSLGNNLQNKEERKSQHLIYQDTILQKQRGERKPQKLQRRYDRAEVKIGDAARNLPYEGKTVSIEKKGDRYCFQIEGGGELTGKDAEELDHEFNRQGDDPTDFNRLMLPKKPVRQGDSWSFDTAALLCDLEKSAPMEFDAAKAKGSAKLLKAYQKDGKQFGIVEYRLEFPMKAFKMGEQKAPIDEGAVMLITARVDGCIDGSRSSNTAKLQMRMKGRAQVAQGGARYTLSFDTQADGVETEKEIARK